MGLEFGRQNPRAAAQITYRSAPGLADAMSPPAALQALVTTAAIYSAGRKRGLQWGYHEPARWQRYVAAAEESGLVKSVDPKQVYTNRLVAGANSIDRTRVALDAGTYGVRREFSLIPIPAGG